MFLRLLTYPFGNAKARAMIPQLLGRSQIRHLAGLASLEEALSSLPGKRLQAEFLALGRKVSRALPARGRSLIEEYLRRIDTENLKIVCRGILSDRPGEDFHPLLIAPGRCGEIPLEKLRQASSLEHLAGTLPRGSYRDVLARAREVPENERLFYLESALDKLFWERVAAAMAALSPYDRLAAGEILNPRADIDRFNVVHRGWRGGLGRQEMIGALPCMGEAFHPDQVLRALRSGNPEPCLRKLFPIRGFKDPLSVAGEVALWRRLHRSLRRTLRSHPFDISIPLAVVLLKEVEIRDLDAVLSGVRLNSGQDRILSLTAITEG